MTESKQPVVVPLEFLTQNGYKEIEFNPDIEVIFDRETDYVLSKRREYFESVVGLHGYTWKREFYAYPRLFRKSKIKIKKIV